MASYEDFEGMVKQVLQQNGWTDNQKIGALLEAYLPQSRDAGAVKLTDFQKGLEELTQQISKGSFEHLEIDELKNIGQQLREVHDPLNEIAVKRQDGVINWIQAKLQKSGILESNTLTSDPLVTPDSLPPMEAVIPEPLIPAESIADVDVTSDLWADAGKNVTNNTSEASLIITSGNATPNQPFAGLAGADGLTDAERLTQGEQHVQALQESLTPSATEQSASLLGANGKPLNMTEINPDIDVLGPDGKAINPEAPYMNRPQPLPDVSPAEAASNVAATGEVAAQEASKQASWVDRVKNAVKNNQQLVGAGEMAAGAAGGLWMNSKRVEINKALGAKQLGGEPINFGDRTKQVLATAGTFVVAPVVVADGISRAANGYGIGKYVSDLLKDSNVQQVASVAM